MRDLTIFFLLFFAASPPVRAQVVKLSYGINYVDIDGDGTLDMITRSYLDNANNNNADFYQVMVRRPPKGRGAGNREWNPSAFAAPANLFQPSTVRAASTSSPA